MLLKRRLSKLVKQTCNVKLTCVFESCKVGRYFSLKCKSSQYLVSNVVYMFKCQHDDGQFYIGETKRHLGTRIAEHLDLSGLKTNVGLHISNCNGCMNDLTNGSISQNSFRVIKSGQNKCEIEVLEALLIKKLQPTLNSQLMHSCYTLRIFH